MNGITCDKSSGHHEFVFSGKGWQYFIISIVNTLLVIITLGIYLPWAVVKCRRYIYSNMTLNGQAFSYKATGGTLFLSLLFVMIVYVVSITLIQLGSFVAGGIILGLLVLSIPFMVVKSLQYQAMMTSLNGVRFGFQCSMLQAWLSLFVLPVVIEVILACVLYFLYNVTGSLGMMTRLIVLGLVTVVGLGIVYGVVYWKWMALVGNGGRFGTHRFAIQINIMQCIKGCVLALVTLLPFIVVIGYLIAPVFTQLIMLSVMGGDADAASGYILAENYGRIITGYTLYFIAIVVVGSYLYVTLRNLFLNNLTLANNAVRFRSSVTGYGMLLRMLLVMLVSCLTLGLAYPWMKMYLVCWLACNTQVVGDLDTLELVNDETPPAGGFLMWISRGMAPYVPFI